VAIRRRRRERMERVVCVPGLWAIAYGNVGSSIYYALGLVAEWDVVHV
jgi:basic amino acid/polyamine antiporter, APA family